MAGICSDFSRWSQSHRMVGIGRDLWGPSGPSRVCRLSLESWAKASLGGKLVSSEQPQPSRRFSWTLLNLKACFQALDNFYGRFVTVSTVWKWELYLESRVFTKERLSSNVGNKLINSSVVSVSTHSLFMTSGAQGDISTLTTHTLNKRPSAYVRYLCFIPEGFPVSTSVFNIPPKIISTGPHLLARAQWFWVGVSRPGGVK